MLTIEALEAKLNKNELEKQIYKTQEIIKKNNGLYPNFT